LQQQLAGLEQVWVDSYALEFSRDMEPTVEGGDRVWRVASSCVNMYKAGRKCSDADAAAELCCTTADKQVFANVWSFSRDDGSDYIWSNNHTEAASFSAKQTSCKENCNPVPGSAVFCTDTGLADARQGPFMLYLPQGIHACMLAPTNKPVTGPCTVYNLAG